MQRFQRNSSLVVILRHGNDSFPRFRLDGNSLGLSHDDIHGFQLDGSLRPVLVGEQTLAGDDRILANLDETVEVDVDFRFGSLNLRLPIRLDECLHVWSCPRIVGFLPKRMTRLQVETKQAVGLIYPLIDLLLVIKELLV